jgi:hypothetical protein
VLKLLPARQMEAVVAGVMLSLMLLINRQVISRMQFSTCRLFSVVDASRQASVVHL